VRAHFDDGRIVRPIGISQKAKSTAENRPAGWRAGAEDAETASA
jgi:hypothetical protein